MQKNCPDCERDATLGAKFCRTCGNRLAPETEVALDNTARYSPQQAAAAQYAADSFSPSPTNPQTPPASTADPVMPSIDTSRLYAPPQPVAAVPPAYPYVPAPPKKRSGYVGWIFFALLSFAVVFAGGIVYQAARRAASKAQRIIEQIPGETEESRKGLSIDALKYPNATIENNVALFGQSILTMESGDSADKIQAYYEKLLNAKPMVIDRASDSIVFKAEGPPGIVITIKKSDKNPGWFTINAIRSTIAFKDGNSTEKGNSPVDVPVPAVPPAPPAPPELPRPR